MVKPSVKTSNYFKGVFSNVGFTLIEVIIVIIITGILVTVAMRSTHKISETTRVEETKTELEALSYAILGNPQLQNEGTRTDFGYVGDIGAMPSNLDDLVSNPGGYSTWKGPYIKSRFTQTTDDFKQDAWNTDYVYTGGTEIVSNGSGSDIVRKLANSSDDLLINQVSGVVLDKQGLCPGIDYRDSLLLQLIVPNGTGGMLSKTSSVDTDGYFSFDSIPVGNHDLNVIYIPQNDTLKRFVSILPQSDANLTYRVSSFNFSSLGGYDIQYVIGSSKIIRQSCNYLSFNIVNTSASIITLTSMTVNWTSPTAYFEKVRILGKGGGTVYDQDDPRAGTGDPVTFSSAITITSGSSQKVSLENFKDVSTGNGNNVDISNTNITITFSDGSIITFNSGSC